MQNTIRFYYDFEDVRIVSKKNDINCVKYNDKIYDFCEVKNKEFVIEAHEITKKYDEYEKIVLNKYKNIFTPYRNKIFVLIEKKNNKKQLTPIREVPNDVNYLLNRANWKIMWEKKIDYFEYQMKHIRGKYKSIDESFDYFIGMAETAIGYVYNNSLNNTEQKVICRRRMEINNYYNPLNIVIDNVMRDVGEYLKMIFWTNKYDEDKIREVLKNIEPISNNYKMLYARLLYPSYYFDAYEKVLNEKASETTITEIIKRTNEYEKYLGRIYKIIKDNYKGISKIDWI